MQIEFTIEQLVLLKELQRNTADADCYMKLTFLIMLHNKFSIAIIADNLGVHISTLYNYYNEYQQDNNFNTYLDKHYVPYSGKLNEQQITELVTYVEENLCNTAKEVASFIKEKFDISYTESGVTALLHRLNFSYKKTKLIPCIIDETKQQQWIEEFKKVEEHLNPQEDVILFADGVHPQHNTINSYAWIKKGTEKTIQSNSGRQRINIIGAIDIADPTTIVTEQVETINALTILVFIQAIEKAYPHKKRIHLYVDNARYHHAILVKEYLQTSRVIIHYLPAYSPNLNPIERLWKLMKKKVINNKFYKTFKEFKNALEQFFDNINDYKLDLQTLINTNFQTLKVLA